MTVRPYKPEDLDAVRSLHERSWPFPDLSNPLYIVKEIAEIEGKIIALGTVRLTSEAMVILDESCPKRTRAAALKELLGVGTLQCQQKGIDEIHTFLTGCDDKTWAAVLEKRFGFVRCSGIPLVRLL